MAQQATREEIPEVETFKQLKRQQELGQKKLAEAEDELGKLHGRIKELEDSVQKGELKKKAALERYASNETSLTELKNEVKIHSLEISHELKNTHELIALVEAAIEKQKTSSRNYDRKSKTFLRLSGDGLRTCTRKN